MADSDEEDCCRYGTPLDPYEEDDVPKKRSAYQDVTEQYALDSQGKRRFHGAFTGGFTAGHCNTVAAPEGWAPQTFKSSRSDRMKLSQKPEDFMDDEDRNEFGIAPKQVHTTKEFSGTKRSRQKHFHDGPIPGEPVLQSLLEPVHETVAISILKGMGWRPGYGIGEKITRKEKKTSRKLYTCHIPTEYRNPEEADEARNESEDSCEDEFSEVLFEPDDFEPYVAKPKVDSFGLGYVGLSRHSILGKYVNPSAKDGDEHKRSHLLTNDKGKKVSIRGQAFGVGALEDEDEDIYARDDMSGYDFALDVSKKSGEKSESKSKHSSSSSILDGFAAASSSVLQTKVYPPPALPHDYIPSLGKARKTRFSNIEKPQSEQVPLRDQGLGRHDLTAKQRGTILGEQKSTIISSSTTKEPDKSKTPVSQSYEERIALITGRNINFTSNSETPKDDDSSSVENKTPSDGIFRPFASNVAKQQRYENFIAMRQGLPNVHEIDNNAKDNKILNWERDREIAEFEQAYKLYKPLTGLMKDKFTPATHQEDLNNPLSVSKDRNYHVHASNERQEAARLGMYGAMTRDTVDWRPEPLLCKRFNVPEPSNGGYVPQGADKKKASYSIFEYLETSVHNKSSYLKEQNELKSNDIRKYTKPIEHKPPNQTVVTAVTTSVKESNATNVTKRKRLTVADLFLQEKEKELEILNATKETNTLSFQKEIEKPAEIENEAVKDTIENFNKIDLYKAVFLSDSESETEADNSNASKEKFIEDITPKNVERNPSPPKGIFANLNFDRINSWRKPDENDDDDDNGAKASKSNQNQKDSLSKQTAQEIAKTKSPQEIIPIVKDAEIYGAKLPERHLFVPKSKVDDKKTKIPPEVPTEVDVEMENAEMYGPKLPEKHLFAKKSTKVDNNDKMDVVELQDSSSSDSSDWVESAQDVDKKSKHKSKKNSKKKKKKSSKSSKHSKHKSKKKHKR